jgi:quinol monooxygenase YgiN
MGIMMMTLKMKVPDAKKKELLQTLDELREIIIQRKGCIQFVCRDNQNEVNVNGAWETLADADAYIRSVYFAVLSGAAKLFSETAALTLETNFDRICIDLKEANACKKVRMRMKKLISQTNRMNLQ